MQREVPRGLIIVVIAVLLLVGVQVALKVFPRPSAPLPTGADVFYFYSSTCDDCKKVHPQMVKLEEARPDLHIEEVDIRAGGAQAANMLARKGRQYQLSTEELGEVPAVFVEDERRAYVGPDDAIKAIMRLIREAPKGLSRRGVTSKR